MSSSVSRAELLSALEQAQYALADKDIVPAYTHVFHADGQIFAFNGEAGITAKWPLVAPPFNVKGEVLLGLLKALDDEGVEITVQDSRITVKCGSHKSTLPQLQDTPAPAPGSKKRPAKYSTCPPGFVEAVKRALHFASRFEQRANLVNVFVKDEYFYSSDGNIACRCHVEGMPEIEALIPRASAQAIVSLGMPQSMARADNTLWLDYGNVVFFTLLAHSENGWPYGMVDNIIDASVESVTQSPVSPALTSALKRMVFLSKGDVFPKVVITPSDKKVRLEMVRSESFSSILDVVEVVDFDVDSVPVQVLMNPELLLKALEFASDLGFDSVSGQPGLTWGEVVDCTVAVMPLQGD